MNVGLFLCSCCAYRCTSLCAEMDGEWFAYQKQPKRTFSRPKPQTITMTVLGYTAASCGKNSRVSYLHVSIVRRPPPECCSYDTSHTVGDRLYLDNTNKKMISYDQNRGHSQHVDARTHLHTYLLGGLAHRRHDEREPDRPQARQEDRLSAKRSRHLLRHLETTTDVCRVGLNPVDQIDQPHARLLVGFERKGKGGRASGGEGWWRSVLSRSQIFTQYCCRKRQGRCR